MLRRYRVWALGLFAALVGSWSPTPCLAQGADPALPFWGTGAGMITGVDSDGALVVEYTGTATHLGAYTREEHLFLNPDGSFTGTIVFTAANGDELWVDFAGAFVSPTTATGTYAFADGTGRFADATGTATFEAETPDGVNVAVTFAGSIRY